MMVTDIEDGDVTELALTLMRRDGLTEAEALEMEQEAREAIQKALMNME